MAISESLTWLGSMFAPQMTTSAQPHITSPVHLFLPFDKKSRVQVGIPESRVLHCTAMALEGLPLLGFPDALPKPPELLESILHSMIGKTPLLHFYSISRHSHLGHYNLFLGGVLHRDISEGNISSA